MAKFYFAIGTETKLLRLGNAFTEVSRHPTSMGVKEQESLRLRRERLLGASQVTWRISGSRKRIHRIEGHPVGQAERKKQCWGSSPWGITQMGEALMALDPRADDPVYSESTQLSSCDSSPNPVFPWPIT